MAKSDILFSLFCILIISLIISGCIRPDANSNDVPETKPGEIPSAESFGLPEFTDAVYKEDKSIEHTKYTRTTSKNKDYAKRIYITDKDFYTVLDWYKKKLDIDILLKESRRNGIAVMESRVIIDRKKGIELTIMHPELKTIAGSDSMTGIHFVMNYI